MIAFNRYKKNPCQLKAQIAFTSQNTPLIARIQPNARIEKVVAVCALPTHAPPRNISRIPNTRNQPQDFLTCSRPATKKSETSVIVSLLSRAAVNSVRQHGAIISAHEHFRSILRNGKLCSRPWIGIEF